MGKLYAKSRTVLRLNLISAIARNGKGWEMSRDGGMMQSKHLLS